MSRSGPCSRTYSLAHVLVGEPVPTSPEHALQSAADGAQLLDLGVGRQHRAAVDVFEVDHDRLAVLERGLAHVGSHGGLMVARAETERPEGAVDLEPGER